MAVVSYVKVEGTLPELVVVVEGPVEPVVVVVGEVVVVVGDVIEVVGVVVELLPKLRAARPPIAIITMIITTIAIIAILLIACLILEFKL